MESPEFMGENECFCAERICALETRIQRMEQLLERVLEQLETQQPVASKYRSSRSHSSAASSRAASSTLEAVALGQPGMAPVVSLHKAAKQGDVLALMRSLYNGGDLAATNQSGDAALHCAVRSGCELAVELLLAAGAPVDAPDIHGATPLSVAACLGQYGVVEILLKKAASVDRPDKDGSTPLMRVVGLRNIKIATLLVKNGASVNAMDHSGDSPLVIASRECLTEILAVLTASEPVIPQMLQAMHAAGSSAVFMSLIKDVPTSAVCTIKNTCLRRVAREGWELPVRALLANCIGRHCCSLQHNRNICQAIAVASTENILLALWATAPTTTRKTALKCAAYRGWVTALDTLLQHWRTSRGKEDSVQQAEVVEALRVAGSEAAAVQLLKEHLSSAKSVTGQQVLCRAAERGWHALLLLLLSHGASADSVRCDGSTLLHCAAARGHTTCVETLIEKGALTSRKDEDGWTPLHLAAEGGHDDVVRCLLSAGADPSDKDPFGLTPCDVASSPDAAEMLKHYIRRKV